MMFKPVCPPGSIMIEGYSPTGKKTLRANDKLYLNNLARHFDESYSNVGNIVQKLKEIAERIKG